MESLNLVLFKHYKLAFLLFLSLLLTDCSADEKKSTTSEATPTPKQPCYHDENPDGTTRNGWINCTQEEIDKANEAIAKARQIATTPTPVPTVVTPTPELPKTERLMKWNDYGCSGNGSDFYCTTYSNSSKCFLDKDLNSVKIKYLAKGCTIESEGLVINCGKTGFLDYTVNAKGEKEWTEIRAIPCTQ